MKVHDIINTHHINRHHGLIGFYVSTRSFLNTIPDFYIRLHVGTLLRTEVKLGFGYPYALPCLFVNIIRSKIAFYLNYTPLHRQGLCFKSL